MGERFLILDCYVDEPACLGVPPFVSPYPRYIYGALIDAGTLALSRPDITDAMLHRKRAALVEAFAAIHHVLRRNASERAAEAVLELVTARRTAR